MIQQIPRLVVMPVVLSALSFGYAGAQAVPPAPCKQSLGYNIQQITAALGLCDQVGRIEEHKLTPQFYSSTNSLRDLLSANATINIAALQATSAISRVNILLIRRQKRSFDSQSKLQIATAIIGLIGGGAGGSLHLVNDPQVGHAATVVGLSAGVVGGGLGIANVLFFPKDDEKPSTQGISYVANWFSLKEGHPLTADDISRSPEHFTDVLSEMSDQLQALQNTVITAAP